MSKNEVIAFPEPTDLLIPSGVFTFENNQNGHEFALEFSKNDLDNSISLDSACEVSMAEAIEGLVDKGSQLIGDNGKINLLSTDGSIKVLWGFNRTHSRDEIKDHAGSDDRREIIIANNSLNGPIRAANNVIRMTIGSLSSLQYEFGIPQDQYDYDRLLPSRLALSPTYPIPMVVVREAMDDWLTQSSSEEKEATKKQVVNFGYSIDGYLERDSVHSSVHLEHIEINGYSNIFFTGSCTYLGYRGDGTIPEMFKERSFRGVREARIQSDDLYIASDRDMNFLDNAPEVSMAVVGAINKAVIEKSRVKQVA